MKKFIVLVFVFFLEGLDIYGAINLSTQISKAFESKPTWQRRKNTTDVYQVWDMSGYIAQFRLGNEVALTVSHRDKILESSCSGKVVFVSLSTANKKGVATTQVSAAELADFQALLGRVPDPTKELGKQAGNCLSEVSKRVLPKTEPKR